MGSFKHFYDYCFKIFDNSNISAISVLASIDYTFSCNLGFSWFLLRWMIFNWDMGIFVFWSLYSGSSLNLHFQLHRSNITLAEYDKGGRGHCLVTAKCVNNICSLFVFVDPQEGNLSLLLGGDGSPYFPCGFHRHWGRLEDHSILVRMQIQPPYPILSATTPKKALGASLWSGKGGSWSSTFSGGQEEKGLVFCSIWQE